MRVTVSNPYHDQKPTHLGLVSLILFARAEDLKANPDTPSKLIFKQIDKEVTDNLLKSIGIEKRDNGARIPNYRAASRRDTLFDDIEDADKPIITPRRVSGRGIDEQGTVLKRGWHEMNNSEGIRPAYAAETKKLKPNYIREGEMRRLRSFADQDKHRGEDDEFQRVIEESKRTHKKEQEQRQSMDNQKWDYTDKFLYKKRPEERDRGDMMWKGEEREKTQDMDDFQKALEESKKTYRQEMGIETDETLIETTKETEENYYKEEKLFGEKYEDKKEDLFVGFGLRKKRQELARKVNVEDPEEVKAYYEMLEKCAEEEEEELERNFEEGGDMEDGNEYKNKEEDDLTDILENSMANLWADSQEVQNKENQDKGKEIEMELELMDEFDRPSAVVSGDLK